MQFLAAGIAVAGLVAACGPIIIHLLNRQRFKTVKWAAMEFLLEAVRRNKKILRLRDIVLLALRCACLVLFGLALARPFISKGGGAASGAGQPVHAVFVIDNSLSMSYRPFNTTLLEDAQARTRELIERLPAGSRISVIPLCGSSNAFSRDAYRTVQDATDALQRIETVDRSATAAQAADLAIAACATVTDLPAKRIVFIGDQQKGNWPQGVLEARLKDLPEMQVVQISAEQPENAWVDDILVQDGVADIETPATIIARIRFEGSRPRPNVQVALAIDNATVNTRSVDLEPGQTREVQFTHQFDLPVEAGQAAFVPVSVSITPDNLAQDDQRYLSVPVVASLPVIFIDQYGETNEKPALNQYGETFPLRRLVAPVTSRGDADRQLVSIQHKTIENLTREQLQDARLVVLAGVERPAGAVPLLRDYVRQGGQLVILAGAEFDPVAWNDQAWLDGAGILPLPLDKTPLGQLPDEAVGELNPFRLDPQSLVADDFYVVESSKEELDDLFRSPVFFKAISADDSEETLKALRAADEVRYSEEQKLLTDVTDRRRDWEARRVRGLSPDDQAKLTADEQQWGEKIPNWLHWQTSMDESVVKPEESARRSQPRILARFNNGKPYIVERKLGKGAIVLATSGAQSQWNNLFKTNAVLLFDQLLRSRLSRTLPQRTLGTLTELVLPVEAAARRADFSLERPGNLRETLTVDALGPEQFGLTLRNLTQRGQYRVSATQTASDDGPARGATGKLWDLSLAVNGPSAESDLHSIDAAELYDRAAHPRVTWIGASQAITLDGTEIAGMNLWAWLLAIMFLCLVAEMILLAWPLRTHEAVAAPEPT